MLVVLKFLNAKHSLKSTKTSLFVAPKKTPAIQSAAGEFVVETIGCTSMNDNLVSKGSQDRDNKPF